MAGASDAPDGAARAPEPTRYVTVGRIGPPRGVRGELFVAPTTDDPETRFAPGAVLRTDPPERGPLTVAASSTAGGKLVVHFEAVDDRGAAQALRGVLLVVEATERPPIEDPDEYYTTDLIGLPVVQTTGREFGPVRDVIDVAGADYLVIEVDGRERLVPFVAAIVPEVDLDSGRIVIDPPDGLFDL